MGNYTSVTVSIYTTLYYAIVYGYGEKWIPDHYYDSVKTLKVLSIFNERTSRGRGHSPEPIDRH